MEGEAISATIEVLVQNLINVSKDEISLIRGLDENAEKLRITFTTIQSFLEDAQSKSITEAAVKTWLKSLEAKAFDADNALDQLNYQRLSHKVPSCFPSFNHCVDRRGLARRINKINTSFESINKTAAELGLQEKLVAAAAVASDETDSLTVDPIFIGRDDDVSKIVDMLISVPTEEALCILPIVGMGGLGKTTLARNVFNHQKTKTHFGQHIWVHVSQHFDALALLKKILKIVKVENIDDEKREGLPKKPQNDDAAKQMPTNLEDESKEDVLKKIQEALKAKTYLLVLDDVWNEDQRKWNDFINSWSGTTSTKGNGILVTTRNTGVASIVKKTLDMHILNGLSDEQCWSIIKGRAFEGGVIAPDLEDIGRSIAERCKGLPLAANVVGGVLRGKSQDEWSSIKESWLSDVGGDENDISKILKLSYHHLPSPSLKKCFAYCSIFPKGAQIDREQLVQLWMAEGFLQPSQTSDMETVGNQFLKVLLHNSLLQVVDRDKYGDIKHCSMHDLVHDVADSILDGTYYEGDASRRIPKGQAKWYICWGCNGDESSRIPKEQAELLRTLFYNDKISDIIFLDFRSLHSLILTDSEVKELPDSIRELIHLRYLDISGAHIKYLPNSIGKLYHLQTLRTGICLLSLPSTLNHLCNLRHIYIDDWETLPSTSLQTLPPDLRKLTLPPYLGKLTSLQTLPCFKVRNKEGHRITELGRLKDLKGELKIYNLENVRGEEESKKACLLQKPGMLRLALMWDGGRKGKIKHMNVLKGLQPHPNIKVLEIIGFKGASFPTWTRKMAECVEGRWAGLNKLMEIRLENCVECEEIPTLGHLPHLKSLYLSGLKKVKRIGASFYGIEECSSDNVFPSLERLELVNMPMLREWEEVNIPSGGGVKVFPCLEYLKVKRCNELRCAPSQFTSLQELYIGWMDSELPLASICGIKLKTLKKLRIKHINGLTCLPDWLFDNNQHLSWLEISGCDKLRELPDGLHSLNSLEELYFRECENLRCIPYSSSSKILQVYGCREMMNYLGEMEMEMKESLLEYASISAVVSDGCDLVSCKKGVDGVLRFGSHSLCHLGLIVSEDWESLPDQLQHLTALSRLNLIGFGIEELPEWLMTNGFDVMANKSGDDQLFFSRVLKARYYPRSSFRTAGMVAVLRREVGEGVRAPWRMSNCFKDREEELSFFRDLKKHEFGSLLQPVSDEFEANNGKHGLGRKGAGLEFVAENGKNDYNWLKTPPATPLFPSLEMELERKGQQLVTQREIPIIQPLSRFAGNSENNKTSTPTGRPNLSSSLNKKKEATMAQKTCTEPKKFQQNVPPSKTESRGVSPLVRQKFEMPPNLRTTTSTNRGRPANQRLSTPQKQDMIGRQSCSSRGRKGNWDSDGKKLGQVVGSRMVERFMKARVSNAQENRAKLNMNGSLNETSSVEKRGGNKMNGSSGFGRLVSKSLDMALKHMK